ncbi:MAG: BON domain-containing protein [Thermoguttaceae bacterium]
MKLLRLVPGLAILFGLAMGEQSAGQLFGTRRAGLGAAAPSETGPALLQGNERFLRGNRRQGNFVGTDLRDRRRFVGVQREGTTSRLRPAAAGFRVQTPPSPNLPPATTVNRATGMYEPRLTVAFEVPERPAAEISERLTRQLMSIPGLHPASHIEVSVEGRTATLRGEVASERDRILAEKVLLFEPGVSEVRNELRLKALPEESQEPPTPSARPGGNSSAAGRPAKPSGSRPAPNKPPK